MRNETSAQPNTCGLLAHAQRKAAETQQRVHQARTDKTKEVLLATRDRRIKALEEENRKLKAQLKEAYGKLYEQV